jgi:hypothetical protein
VLETALLLRLIRFLSLRLKPKAAAAPRAGRGPGTGAVDDVEKVTTIKVLVLRLPAVSGVVARGSVGMIKVAFLHQLIEFPIINVQNCK